MKALILNSGLGSRMGALTKEHPKCMTEIRPGETIVSRQLRMLCDAGIREAVMTTGVFAEVLQEYCDGLGLPIRITYVLKPRCRETNYIYSIYCARQELEDDLVLMHGDLVFSRDVLDAQTTRELKRTGGDSRPAGIRKDDPAEAVGLVATVAAATLAADHAISREFVQRLWDSENKPYEDGYFDAYYVGLLRLFAFMHLSGHYRVIEPTK